MSNWNRLSFITHISQPAYILIARLIAPVVRIDIVENMYCGGNCGELLDQFDVDLHGVDN